MREREIERQREGKNSLRVGQGSQRFKPVPQGMIIIIINGARGEGGRGRGVWEWGGGGVALRYATSPSKGSSLFDSFEAGLHYAEKRANV